MFFLKQYSCYGLSLLALFMSFSLQGISGVTSSAPTTVPAPSSNTSANVSAQLATTAFLPCPVEGDDQVPSDKQVSWIRRRDFHVLTSGGFTYAEDERFSIQSDWTLTIKYLQARDNGTYECQISTDTGIVSRLVHLHVIVPEAFILGNQEFHVERGSAINLYCIVEQSLIPPQFIFWRRGENQLLSSSEDRVDIRMEHGAKTASRLIVSGATVRDSGKYTCGAPNAEPATVHVFVSQGDKTAAIQRWTSGGGAPLHLFFLLTWPCLIPLMLTAGQLLQLLGPSW